MSDRMARVLGTWSSLGAGFDVEPTAPADVDLERLLLDTAREAPAMARLFVVAATWLHQLHDTVARHRLTRLVADELEVEHRPVLGLLLDVAQQGTHPRAFTSVVARLPAASPPRPLFEAFRRSEGMTEIARSRTADLSRAWGLWAQPIELKSDVIRPAAWIMARHPPLRTRADFRGDLRASIMAALRHDAGAGASEVRLAELAGGSRSQVRNALANLQLTGRVAIRRAQRANRREIAIAA